MSYDRPETHLILLLFIVIVSDHASRIGLVELVKKNFMNCLEKLN